MHLEDVKVGHKVNIGGHIYKVTKNTIREWNEPKISLIHKYIKPTTNYYRSRMCFQRIVRECEEDDIFYMTYDDIEYAIDKRYIEFLKMSRKNNYY